jgi:FMN-dependent NADH-azoreductase
MIEERKKKGLVVAFFRGEGSRTKLLWEEAKTHLRGLAEFDWRVWNLAEAEGSYLRASELLTRSAMLPEEARALKEADALVIASPIWNFSVPAQVKGFLDRATVPGYTFTYGPEGMTSFVKGRPAWILATSGGEYPAQGPQPTQAVEQWLEFLGFQRQKEILVQGLDFPQIEAAAVVRGSLKKESL